MEARAPSDFEGRVRSGRFEIDLGTIAARDA
jgi:hypothetical protein